MKNFLKKCVPLIACVAKTKKPLIIFTGMATVNAGLLRNIKNFRSDRSQECVFFSLDNGAHFIL